MAYRVQVWLKTGAVVSTGTMEGPAPQFGTQVQVVIDGRTIDVRIDGLAMNQPHGKESIDVVRAVEQ